MASINSEEYQLAISALKDPRI